jgi:hypothetical protein
MSFITQSPTYQRLLEQYYESESPVVSTLRSVTSTIGSWFDENETARVVKAMREIDPDFRMEKWQTELREYIVPEVVDAYLSADREGLKEWCGEAVGADVFRDKGHELIGRHTMFYGQPWANTSSKASSRIARFWTSTKST